MRGVCGGGDGRTDVFSQTDLLLQHEFRLAGARRVQLSLNVLNLFNQDAATSKFVNYQYSGGVIPSGHEDPFYAGSERLADLIVSQNVPKDPRFLMNNAFQAPIQARFGVEFLF